MSNANTSSSSVDKSAYVRKSANLVPTGLPMKRTPEGSIITGGSITKGPIQPFHRTTPQKASQVIKGGGE